jgi:hypothetical protein
MGADRFLRESRGRARIARPVRSALRTCAPPIDGLGDGGEPALLKIIRNGEGWGKERGWRGAARRAGRCLNTVAARIDSRKARKFSDTVSRQYGEETYGNLRSRVILTVVSRPLLNVSLTVVRGLPRSLVASSEMCRPCTSSPSTLISTSPSFSNPDATASCAELAGAATLNTMEPCGFSRKHAPVPAVPARGVNFDETSFGLDTLLTAMARPSSSFRH